MPCIISLSALRRKTTFTPYLCRTEGCPRVVCVLLSYSTDRLSKTNSTASALASRLDHLSALGILPSLLCCCWALGAPVGDACTLSPTAPHRVTALAF